jgi:hypothetical protein
MATRHITDDDFELYALNGLAESDAAPVGPALAVPPLVRRPAMPDTG